MNTERKLAKRVSYAKYGYVFSLPFIIAFLIFSMYPLLYTVVIGFTDLQGVGVTDFNFNWNVEGPDGNMLSPFHNFIDVFNSPLFRTALKNTIFIWMMNFIPQIVLSLALASWFTNKMLKLKCVGFFKVLFYMPNIITAASVAVLFSAMFAHPIGPMNDFLMRFGFADSPTHFLQNRAYAQGLTAFIQFWMWYGVTMIILVAGVMGISPTLFEAAAIDGANHFKTFFYVTLPSLRTVMLYTLVTSFVGGMQMFDIPFLFHEGTPGAPQNSTLTTSIFIYNQAMLGMRRFNRAAAASVLMFILILICSAVLFYLMRDKDAAKQKKEFKQREKARRIKG